MPSLNIKDYIIMILITTMLGMWWSYDSEIAELEKDKRELVEDKEDINNNLTTCNQSVGIHIANEVRLEASIKLQNEKIQSLKVSYDKKIKELEEWKKKPKSDKYKKLYDKLKELNLKTGEECENIKNLSDGLDGFSLDSL